MPGNNAVQVEGVLPIAAFSWRNAQVRSCRGTKARYALGRFRDGTVFPGSHIKCIANAVHDPPKSVNLRV